MTVFVCNVCGHIEFDEAPPMCLVCRADSKAFQADPAAVKTAADPANPTEAEKKHLPDIVVVKECGLISGPCTDVHVRVGAIEHPMQAAHYIRYIDYYLNRAFVSRVWLSPETCHPAAALHLTADSGTITAVENCNVHGTWMSEATL